MNSNIMSIIICYIVLFISGIYTIIYAIFRPFGPTSQIKKVEKPPKPLGNTYHTKGGGTYKNKNCDFGETEHKIDYKNVDYYRDLPCGNDYFRAYWLIYNYQLGSHDEDLIICLFLKWIREGNIRFEKKQSGNTIHFIKPPKNSNEIEEKIYSYIVVASFGNREMGYNIDNELDVDEFRMWYYSNTSKFNEWFSEILDYEVKSLIKEGKIRIEKKKIKNIYKYEYTLRYIVDKSMKEEAIKLAGLKKFLIDFSIIHDREVLEVMLFDDYLIYAALFGISNRVYSNLNKLFLSTYKVNTNNRHTISYEDISTIKYIFKK